jgi:hypothetical protein
MMQDPRKAVETEDITIEDHEEVNMMIDDTVVVDMTTEIVEANVVDMTITDEIVEIDVVVTMIEDRTIVSHEIGEMMTDTTIDFPPLALDSRKISDVNPPLEEEETIDLVDLRISDAQRPDPPRTVEMMRADDREFDFRINRRASRTISQEIR